MVTYSTCLSVLFHLAWYPPSPSMLFQIAKLHSFYDWAIVCCSYIPQFCSSVDGHLVWFCILAIVRNAAMNIGIHVCFWIRFMGFFEYVPESESEVAQSCPTLFDPIGCNLPGSSIHGTFQARVLGWVVISFSRGSSQPRDWTQVSHIAGRRITHVYLGVTFYL